MKEKLRIAIRKILRKELAEGITYNDISNNFTFDFENDGKTDIIKLNRLELEKVNFY